jgi:hypothetical protein
MDWPWIFCVLSLYACAIIQTVYPHVPADFLWPLGWATSLLVGYIIHVVIAERSLIRSTENEEFI